MITDRFVQICPSRTGSSSIKILLYELAEVGKVTMIDRVPHTSYYTNVQRYRKAGYEGRIPPTVVSVRNPWDWYVSRWWYSLGKDKLNFAPTFRGHMECVSERVGEMHGDLERGTFTHAWNHVGGDHADYVRRYENFVDNAIRIWYAVMPDLVHPETWRTRLQEIGRFDSGMGNLGVAHKPYWHYYDDELRGWVARWDEGLIARFGYSFREG